MHQDIKLIHFDQMYTVFPDGES